jgi:hypothetical protein
MSYKLLRPPGILLPSSSTGYFWHGVESALIELLPEWAQRMALILMLKPYKRGNLDSEVIGDLNKSTNMT